MLHITIKEFKSIISRECAAHNESVKHSDDIISLQDWASENKSIYEQEYGIVWDYRLEDWSYDQSNKNWKGDDICSCCDGYYDSFKEGTDDMCGDCSEDEDGDYPSPEDYSPDTDALGRNFSDADNGL